MKRISSCPKQPARFPDLSYRELECFRHIILGMSAREISVELKISKRTVEEYVERIKNKLGCMNKREIISLAFNTGYVQFS